ncbi:hypothetical protein [Catellatospora sichuanensis]|uniref:hypothetical protein n=1 Tax=Catellatospora sichuanensis TaxID=1969805 RepID=UPI001182F76C|nr:hypothetical protein [Catellatospora sichuanensis]
MKIRTALAAGASMLLAGGLSAALAAPAHAADGIDLGVTVTGSRMSADAEGKWFRVDMFNVGTVESGDARITYDFSGLNSSLVRADLSIYDETFCDVGAVVSCDLVGFAPGERYTDWIYLQNVGGMTGSAGRISVLLTTPGEVDGMNNEVLKTVELVPGGVDLVPVANDLVDGYTPAGKVIPIKPGQSAPLAWAIGNEGDAIVHGVDFTITLPPHVRFGEVYDICEVSEQETEVLTCSDPDVVIPPGGVYSPQGALVVTVDDSYAGGPIALRGGLVSAKAIEQVATAPAGEQPADGFEVAADLTDAQLDELIEELIKDLVANAEQASEVDEGDNDARFSAHVGAPLAVDQAISVTQGIGRVGDTVKIKVAVSNIGKASTRPMFYIKVPSGTSFVAPAVKPGVGSCIDRGGEGPVWEYTGETELACGFEPELQPGRTLTRELLVHIDSATIGNNGFAEVVTTVGKDGNPKNDIAKVIIKIGTPPAGGNNGGNGGGLPVTGTNVGLIAGIGGAVVVAGAVLFLMTRRRKIAADETEA